MALGAAGGASTLGASCSMAGSGRLPRSGEWDRLTAFLVALEAGREPAVSGRRNLGTMELVEACYRSAEENRVVELGANPS